MAINKIKEYSMPSLKEIEVGKLKWNLSKEKAVLLVHDMQEYFLNPYDTGSELISRLTFNIHSIVELCVKNDIPVVYSAQPAGQTIEQRGLLFDRWGEGIPAGEGKEKILASVRPNNAGQIIKKWRYNAFERTPLETLMKEDGKNQLIICGVYGHIGCLATAISAYMKDIKPFLVCDAMADFSKEKHIQALNYANELCGRTVDVESVKAEIQGTRL